MNQPARDHQDTIDDSQEDLAKFCRWLANVRNVAEALAQLRRKQELPLRDVAEFTGLSTSYIDRVERGQRKPERDTLIALLLAGYSLPVSKANRILLFAGYAPLHHERLALSVPLMGRAPAHEDEAPAEESSERADHDWTGGLST
jgi:transcriptional regulator with XRE-family HTH domain